MQPADEQIGSDSMSVWTKDGVLYLTADTEVMAKTAMQDDFLNIFILNDYLYMRYQKTHIKTFKKCPPPHPRAKPDFPRFLFFCGAP